ncbi:MAG: undecaprenyldiphospho-muramoylpentapeptide beta-N-acetylglucosaminyltransferase [Gammaproteobacteria bacterium]|nr:undecaprenyldiphospho-muramoylpentapeptide beta-N-acetylglucosaminyltransferase [Gammaproteobacteria bacterium]MBP9729014.1 undecaprenyldiphospho-muramoylpentapeptide beta-N-acetylglucosaminyltransferase [Gammaproteobacteria bacterium]
MAGGTGGHIFPGLALADYLQEKGWTVAWLGTTKGLEAELIPKAGLTLHTISIEGLRGKGWAAWLRAPLKLLIALGQALKILHRLKPRLVVGMGGFVSGPGGLAAWFLGIPLVIHEQNAVAGTTNRCLAPFSAKVLEGFPRSFKSAVKALYTGNPVRQAFLACIHPTQRFEQREGPLKLLIVGGSRGARVLNHCCPKALAILPVNKRPLIWHQTGRLAETSTLLAYKQAGVVARVDPFIDDMAAAYAWADIVLCRAGALTVAELAAVGVASILVPFPFAVDDHQRYNACFLEAAGAARLINESDLSPEHLVKVLGDLLEKPALLCTMAIAAYAVSKRDARLSVGAVCEELLNVQR